MKYKNSLMIKSLHLILKMVENLQKSIKVKSGCTCLRKGVKRRQKYLQVFYLEKLIKLVKYLEIQTIKFLANQKMKNKNSIIIQKMKLKLIRSGLSCIQMITQEYFWKLSSPSISCIHLQLSLSILHLILVIHMLYKYLIISIILFLLLIYLRSFLLLIGSQILKLKIHLK